MATHPFSVLPRPDERPTGPAAILALALAGGVPTAGAQEIEPRNYSNAPIGVNFLVASYAYLEGGVAVDPSIPLENANIQVHTTLLGYAHTLDVLGQSAKLNLILPYAWMAGSADLAGQHHEREVSGLGDPRLRFSVNLYGAPALSLQEFASYRQDTIIGASVQVTLPTGQYDPQKLVNVGTNRPSLKLELGLSKALAPVTLELATAVSFYGDNDEFLGVQTREQDPIYSIQGGIVYSFPRGIWASLNGTYFSGGRTAVDGVRANDRQENSRAGLTLALPVDRHNSVKIYANSGVSTRTGGDYDAIGIAWQHRWGGGL